MIKLPARVWLRLDRWAHRLRRRHLLPRAVLHWVCNRMDAAYFRPYDDDDFEEVD